LGALCRLSAALFPQPALEAVCRTSARKPAWRPLVAGLLLTALVSLSTVRVCTQEVPGADEWMLGVPHEKVGKGWYHCEPWIPRAFR